ncbi:MAG: DUF2752 domain-containing protein [Verrucomicrobiota bacterium]|nr:DUF2752 domain-containing protein [Verrucomicrobiota bacterium]
MVARPLAPGEIDHETIWLAVSVIGIVLAGIWLALHLPWPFCVFHAVTGHPCPTCGLTRAAIAFCRGDFLAAWHWNPLATVGYCGVIAFDFYAAVVLMMRWPRLRMTPLKPVTARLFRLAFLVLFLANWIYLWRNPAV